MALMGSSLFKRLANQEVLTPYLEKALEDDNWPDHYNIRVDTRPHDSKFDDYFHPSTHCLMSPRKLQMLLDPRYRNDERMVWEKWSATSVMTVSYGSAIHAIIQTQMKMAGLITDDDIEVPLVNEEIHAKGHMDVRVEHFNGKRYCVDIKTRNSRAFDADRGPLASWVAQLNCYMDWEDCDDGIVLVIESGYPFRMKEWHIKRDYSVIDPIYARWNFVRESIKAGREIEELCCTPKSLDKYCPARFLCWEKELA